MAWPAWGGTITATISDMDIPVGPANYVFTVSLEVEGTCEVYFYSNNIKLTPVSGASGISFLGAIEATNYIFTPELGETLFSVGWNTGDDLYADDMMPNDPFAFPDPIPFVPEVLTDETRNTMTVYLDTKSRFTIRGKCQTLVVQRLRTWQFAGRHPRGWLARCR